MARQRIRLEELKSTRDEGFDALYRLYEECFPLADEREPPEAFQQIFELNQDLKTQEAFGPYREVVTILRAWDGGPVVGGHIFGVTTSPAHIEAGYPSSIQGIYTFIHPDFRGLVLINEVVEYSRELARHIFLPPPRVTEPPILFFEVNNPARMTKEEIEQDTVSSGVSPTQRYRFWLRSGFRPLDFEYVQPRLRPDAEPVKYLDLFCSEKNHIGISKRLLINHLKSFISISVLKDADAYRDLDFSEMVNRLNSGSRLSTKKIRNYANSIETKIWKD